MNLLLMTEQKNDLAVYVMTHGPECTWLADYCIPLEIGAACRDKHCCELRDDMGEDTISEKDRLYCELTGLYWMWKNDQHEYVGLYHYRRIFHLTGKQIRKYLSEYDIIMPPMIPISPSVDKEYIRQKIPLDWEILKTVLLERYPEYYESAKQIFPMNKSYAYNMFITNKKIFQDYCNWLFPLLQEIELRLTQHEDRHNQYLHEREKADYLVGYYERAIGFLAERLIHIYVVHHQLKVKEVKIWYVPPYVPLSPKCPQPLANLATSNFLLYNVALFAQGKLYSLLRKIRSCP